MQNELKVEYNLFQNPNGIFYRNRETNPKTHIQPKDPPDDQNNLEKGPRTSWFKTILQSSSHLKSVALV